MNTRKRGFTLIELLVVVAIIGILAAILFPVFARAREQARRASCASNLKQIGLAMIQYRQDYDEKFPIFGNVDVGLPGWAEKLEPYTKNIQLFQCPSEARPQLLPQNYTDYFMSTFMLDQPQGVSEGEIPFPSNTISNGEGRTSKSDLYCQAMRGGEASCVTGNNTVSDVISGSDIAANARRHSEGANYLFVDGHVKWLRPESTMEGNYTNVVTADVFGFKFRSAF